VRAIGTIGAALLAAAFGAAAASGSEEPAARLRQRAVVALDIRPVAVDGDDSIPLRSVRLTCAAGEPCSARLAWPWPGWHGTGDLRITAAVAPAESGGVHRVALEGEWNSPDGAPVRAQRELRIPDGSASVVELWASGRRRLTLAVQADLEFRVEPVGAPAVGRPVAFQVRIEAVRPEGAVLLETNDLTTFIGQPVEYSFRRGEGGTFEALRLALSPARISGDVLEFSVELSGTIAGPAGEPVPVSLRRTVLATRTAITSVTAPEGEPATGYRFAIATAF